MGTYSPLPHIANSIIEEAIETIIKPTVKVWLLKGVHSEVYYLPD